MKKALFLFLSLLTMGTLWAQGTAEVKVNAECGDYVDMTAIPQTGYHFLEWQCNGAQVSTSATFTIQAYSDSTFEAVFEIDSFLIRFVNYNNTELQSGYVDYGVTPSYDYDAHGTPEKPATVQWTYTFSGWDPTITPATHDTVYVAKFDSVLNEYTITFVNEDGTQLQQSDWKYGTTPVYNGATPSKPNPETGKTYTFVGWTETIVPVTGDKTYTAKFSETLDQFNVIVSADPASVATVSGGGTFTYNASVTLTYAITDNCYKFLGWYENNVLVSSDKAYTFNMPLNDRNIVAKFEKIKYTITIRTKTGDTTQGGVTGQKK